MKLVKILAFIGTAEVLFGVKRRSKERYADYQQYEENNRLYD